MGKKYLIDTNTLLEYIGNSLPSSAMIAVGDIVNDNFMVSIINRIEILGHKLATQDLVDFLDLAKTFQLTKEVELQTIELRKKKNIKLPDAIIAATALVNNLTIISRNTKDFQNIKGLSYVNPYEM